MAEIPSLQHTQLLGNSEYEAALDTILEKPQKTVRIFENSLGRGYNSPRRFDLLRAFLLANPRNRLQIVAHDVQSADRNCPRLLNLVRLHAHAISIHETHQAAKAVYDPFAIVDDLHYVHRFHFEELRGVLALHDPIGAHTLIERFGEIWEASSPAVSAKTLGL